jgi:hypothetical protein
MEQRTSLKANTCSAGQKIPCSLCNLKVHYRVHKVSPLVPSLNDMTPVHILLPYFFKIHFNIMPHLCLCLPNALFPSGHLTKILYARHIALMHATWTVHLILLDLIDYSNSIWWTMIITMTITKWYFIFTKWFNLGDLLYWHERNNPFYIPWMNTSLTSF